MTQLEVLQPQKQTLMRPIVNHKELVQNMEEINQLIVGGLTNHTDYGVIPGTHKPTLLKPGAEKLCRAFGVSISYDIVDKEINHDRENNYHDRKGTPKTSQGLYRFSVRCSLHTLQGVRIGDGIGSCSTMEKKFIWSPRDNENTVLKMAQKRALVGAVLNCFSLSDRFTQDVEDMDMKASYTEKPAKVTTVSYHQPKEPAPKPTSFIYKKDNEAHQLWLSKKLEAANIPTYAWDDVATVIDTTEVSEETFKVTIEKFKGHPQ